LVRNNLVKRAGIVTDRRSTIVSLLPEGRAIAETYQAQRQSTQEAIMANFSDEELKTFHRLLEKYIRYSLEQEENIDLICLQCNGAYDQECTISAHSGHCYLHILRGVGSVKQT